jgi:hypothetical protein
MKRNRVERHHIDGGDLPVTHARAFVPMLPSELRTEL